MRWNLKIILTIISLSLIGYTIYSFSLIFLISSSLVGETSEMLNNSIIDGYFKDSNYTPHIIIPYLFLSVYFLLNIYIIKILLSARKITERLITGEFIYQNQQNEFQKVGSGFIIFGKSKYALFMIIGVLFYNDISTYIEAIPEFFLFYLMGKILLVISEIIKKGELLKAENDLTI